MAAFSGNIELRWYGISSGAGGAIHFRSAVGGTYVKTGTGNFIGLGASFTALPGHTAGGLPAAANSVYVNQGNLALTEFPYYQAATRHWGIKGLGNRWEVNNYPGGPALSTIHRVWARADAKAVLTIDKTAATPVDANGNGVIDAGDTITYNFSVRNVGTVNATGVTVSDAKLGMSGVAVSPSTLVPGAAGSAPAVTYTITAADVAAGQVLNTASTAGTDASGPAVGSSDTVTTPIPRGTLTVTKNVTGGPASLPSSLTFPFTVSCTVPSALSYTGMVTVPAGTAKTANTTLGIPAGAGGCTIAEGTKPTPPTNYSWGTETYVQPAATAMPAGGTASGTINNPLLANADLSITKTNSVSSVTSGATTTYTIVVSNGGPVAANGAVAKDTPSVGLTGCTVQSCNASAGASCPSVPGDILSAGGVAIPTFPNGASVTFSVGCTVQ